MVQPTALWAGKFRLSGRECCTGAGGFQIAVTPRRQSGAGSGVVQSRALFAGTQDPVAGPRAGF
jgi:hypothetical protein